MEPTWAIRLSITDRSPNAGAHHDRPWHPGLLQLPLQLYDYTGVVILVAGEGSSTGEALLAVRISAYVGPFAGVCLPMLCESA